MRLAVAAALVLVVAWAPAQAADEKAMNEVRLTMSRLLSASQDQMQAVSLRERALDLFYATDIDGITGVSQSDLDLAVNIEVAQAVSRSLQRYLAFDLDGDLRVTQDEVRSAQVVRSRKPLNSAGVQVRPTEEQASKVLDQLVEQIMKADSKSDGVITLEEMRGQVTSPLAGRDPAILWGGRIPLGLASADGIVSLADYENAIEVVLAEIDLDKNGVVASDEAESYHKKVGQIELALRKERQRDAVRAKLRADAAACGLPQPSNDALIAVVDTYEGAALSSVSIGDDGEEIRAAQVDIQPGDRPLYVVLKSHRHTIWQFSGATGRIAQVVAMSAGQEKSPRSGVVGIDKSRVVIKPVRGCLGPYANPQDADAYREAIEVAFGRSPDVVASRRKISIVRLPAGTTSETEPYAKTLPPPASEPARAVYDEALRFYPLGVVEIDPASVVAAAPAQRYKTLPSNLGIAYLIEKGVIEVSGYAQAMEIGNTTVIGNATVEGVDASQIKVRRVPHLYRIIGPMMFPAGLHGAHSASFVVAKGVRMPDGDPGHSQVTCEVTGAPLQPGEMCQ